MLRPGENACRALLPTVSVDGAARTCRQVHYQFAHSSGTWHSKELELQAVVDWYVRPCL
jgi:hypothetical protein